MGRIYLALESTERGILTVRGSTRLLSELVHAVLDARDYGDAAVLRPGQGRLLEEEVTARDEVEA